MNNTRPLLLLFFLVLTGLFAFNSYADEVIIENEEGTYTGEASNGVPNGQGTYTFASGSKYVGGWKDGMIHGQGTYTDPDGDKHVGGFSGGKFKDGNMIATYSEGVMTEK